MKKYTVYTTLLLFLFSCGESPRQTDNSPRKQEAPVKEAGIKGEKGKSSFNKGLSLVKKTGKVLMVDFFADWCTFCKKMERETFMNPDVKKKLDAEYVRVRLNTDKNGNEKIVYKNETMSVSRFSRMMGVQGLPTVIFIDKEENLITAVPGYIDKSVFLPLLNYIGKRCYEKKISFEVFMQNRKSCI